MLYEITREPKVVLPIMLAAIVATAGAQLLFRDSIYTLKLRRRGVRIGSLTDLTLLRRLIADDVPLIPARSVKADDPLQLLIDLAGETNATDFVVVDEKGDYQGIVTGSYWVASSTPRPPRSIVASRLSSMSRISRR